MRKLFGPSLLVTLPLLAALLSASPATAAPAATVDVTSATLVAKGAAIDLGVSVTCPAGDTASLFVSVTQRSGKSLAQGSGSTANTTCTGQAQTFTIRAAGRAGGAVFKKGPAAVTTELVSCGLPCERVETNETVDVGR
jgi:hypothetical protein